MALMAILASKFSFTIETCFKSVKIPVKLKICHYPYLQMLELVKTKLSQRFLEKLNPVDWLKFIVLKFFIFSYLSSCNEGLSDFENIKLPGILLAYFIRWCNIFLPMKWVASSKRCIKYLENLLLNEIAFNWYLLLIQNLKGFFKLFKRLWEPL